jgi:WD40 repeat protein
MMLLLQTLNELLFYFASFVFTSIMKSISTPLNKSLTSGSSSSKPLSLNDNLVIGRRKIFLKNFLDNFFPIDLSKLISEYDYHIEGISQTIKYDSSSWNFFALQSDNRLIVTNYDRINMCNLQTGKWDTLPDMNYRNEFINCIVKLPDDRIVVGLNNGSLKIWNPQTEIYDLIFKGHDKAIYYINTFCDECDNLLLISGSHDSTIKIWDLTNGNCKTVITNMVRADRLFSVLPDKRLLIQSCNDSVCKIKIWNLKNKEYDIIFDINFVLFCHFLLPNGQMATGLNNGKIKIWDTHTMSEVQTLTGHSKYVECIAVLPDGRLISGSVDRTIKIWNLQTGECDNTLTGHTNTVYYLAVIMPKQYPTSVLSDGPSGCFGRIVSGSRDNTLKIWS